MSVLDVRGKSFDTVVSPQRIVSLVPSITETLFAFGAGDRVVGVTDYCIHPADQVVAKTKIGGTKSPRGRDILALQPDLVIANVEENRRADVAELEAHGILVFVTFARTVRSAIAEMRALAELIGATGAGRLIDPIERSLDALGPRERRARVFVAIWRDPWMTANDDTYIGDLIKTCGGQNIFADRERLFPLAADLGRSPARTVEGADIRYPRVSLEEVAALNPDVILLPDEPYRFGEKDAEELRRVPGLERVPVRRVDGTLVSWYGIRMERALETLPQILII
ncbi:MAG: helical backbone metal receptor [Acidobacteriota bacterium]